MICKKCVIDDKIPGVVFDGNGVCNYCKLHDEMEKQYPVDKNLFNQMIQSIKESGEQHSKYDAVIGVSGGCDSSYLMYLLKQNGVRLLAVHMDNGFNTVIAKRNIDKMVSKLGIDLKIVKIPSDVFNSLCRSFLYAGTPDADIPNDLALLETVKQVAMDNGVHYVINGHSFRTEGTAPLGWTYMDGRYLESVNERFENVDVSDFPHLSWDKQKEFWDFGIHEVRPLYFVDYNKNKVISFLKQAFDWEWYHGLHAENIYTKFVSNYLWVKKFGIDYRKIEFSALIRSHQMDRAFALEQLKTSKEFEESYLDFVLKRLGLSYRELEEIIKSPVHSYKEFDNYLPRFRDPSNRAYFERLLRENKIPFTFYKKYVLGV